MDRRTFLLAAAANGAAATLAHARPAPVLEGQATRLAPDKVRLSWTAKGQPASVYVSSDPVAPRSFMRAIKEGAAGGGADLPLAVSPRPYFLVTTKDGAQTRLAERLLPLQGGRNFRDLGGYRAADGRQVTWGRIYRSGVMSGLTLADLTYLSKLGVQVVCDLRSVQERTSEPTPMLKGEGPEVVAFDYDMASSLDGLSQARTRAQAVDAFAAAYVGFLDMLTPQYTDLFARLVRREAPLAMNCSAGKDRTGMGSALVLSALGVPRETVIADYALTQVYTPPGFYQKQMAASGKASGVSAQQAQAFTRMPPEVLNVIMGSDPQVMRQALAAIDAKFGGPVELAKARFGLTDAKVDRLRNAYLV